MGREANSRKEPHGEKEALALARQAARIVSAKGTRIVELDLGGKPKKAEILGLLLGPTGGLRAPTMRVGSTLYVGFPRQGGFPGLR